MTVKQNELGLMASSTGVAGGVCYTSADEPVSEVVKDGFWATRPSNEKDGRAYDALKTFIELQEPKAGIGVPITIIGASGATRASVQNIYLDSGVPKVRA